MAKVRVLSFGYLHGTPPVADITLDLRRKLRDPAHVPTGAMLDMDGRDQVISDFVFATPRPARILRAAIQMVQGMLDVAGDDEVIIAFGCAGGRHRSVALAIALARIFGVEAEHLHVHLPRVIK